MYPVQRKSDNAIGMYDFQSSSFYTIGENQTPLTAGPVVDEYFDITIDPSLKQRYTNSDGFVVPKNKVLNDSTVIMTLDEDVKYILFSAHMYHQAVPASGDSASITVTSRFSAGGTNDAVHNTSKSATSQDPSGVMLLLENSGDIANVYVSTGIGTTNPAKASVKLT